MSEELGYEDSLGPTLRSEAEKQLLNDLHFYGIASDQCFIDWSEACPEGKIIEFLGGVLENWSEISVDNQDGEMIAFGWIDYLISDDNTSIFIYWKYLTAVHEDGRLEELKVDPSIPRHIVERMKKPEEQG
jgi:hypothetical protein